MDIISVRLAIVLIAIPLFLISAFGYIFVKLRLKPKDHHLDDLYWELQDRHPDYVKYSKYLNLAFTGVIISMLLLFIALAI